MNRYSRLGWTCVLALAALAATAFAAPRADAKQKPALVVKSVSFLSEAPHYIVLSRVESGLAAVVNIKNQGKSTIGGDGKLIVSGLGTLQPTNFVFEVPKIKPGRSESIDIDLKGSDLSGITSYSTEGCASTGKGNKKRNHCRSGPGFAVIPRTWTGTSNATYFDGLVTQSLVSNNATFTLDVDKTAANDVFTYLGTGSLTATITGDEEPECTMRGTGDTAIDPLHASLGIDTDLLTYRAVADIPDSVTYAAQAFCDDGHVVPFQQTFGVWLTTAVENRDASDEVLAGTADDSGGDTWSWDLRAE